MNWPAVYELLDIGFPGLRESIERMAPLGCVWSEVSTPFVEYEGDRPVAHAGVVEMDLVVEGRPMHVPGIHAVCTHPDHQGKGHARAVMERALAHVDERFETSLLFADVPAMYEKFGFRTLPQSRFHLEVDATHDEALPPRPCPDAAFVRERLAERAPTSLRLGCVATEYLFVADLVLSGLDLEDVRYAEDLDALLVFRLRDGALTLYDVVAKRMPPLAAILARAGGPVRTIEFAFTPDRFDAEGVVATPWPEEVFMVRGPWPEVSGPFRFPQLAQC